MMSKGGVNFSVGIYRLLIALALCGITGVMLCWSAPALATAPIVEEESALNVTSTSVTLSAQVNPGGVDMTYRFEYDTREYGSSATHGTNIPSPEGSVGKGSSPVTVEEHVQGLTPGTAYHFRLVAKNAEGEEGGRDQSFTTQISGGEFALPDTRQYELVSPPSTQGAVVEPIGIGIVQASEDGGAITYVAEDPLGANPAGNPQFTQVFSQRATDGAWASQDISTPHEVEAGVRTGDGQEYRYASSSLSLTLVEPLGEVPLSPLATERTAYIRDDISGSYEPLVTSADVRPGAKFGALFPEGVHFLGATPDLSRVVFKSDEALTPNAVKNAHDPGFESLYEWTAGKPPSEALQLVSVLPNERPATEPEPLMPEESLNSSLGDTNQDVRNAISTDGSRIVWSTGQEHLYIRDMNTGETVQLDKAQGIAEAGFGAARFQIASSDGSRIFFTDEQPLTANSKAKGGDADLYECEVVETAGKLACKLSDLTESSGSDAQVLEAVLGASESGSYVYFVANGVLASGAEPGDCQSRSGSPSPDNRCSLYVSRYDESTERWATTFIATLPEEDYSDWSVLSGGGEYLGHLTARVSANGHYLTFMSHESLTGYDNRDARDSEAQDEEVYLYDAESHRLVCASCDSTGARPVGLFDEREIPLVDHSGASENQWIAGSIPGWTPMSGADGSALYQSRYLSNEGRLFFDSTDALVPQDTNGKEDVYEYEPKGVGNCTSITQSASQVFSEKVEGCVGLISSGTSAEESAFLDASVSGGDVFFLTSAKLVLGDPETAYHVYDAHVCGAEGVACTTAVVSSPPCTTVDSCRAASLPQPAIFGAPSSATFSGAGDVSVATAEPGPVTQKALTRAQRRARALKACNKKPKKKQAMCRLQVRKMYTAKKAKAKKNLSSEPRRRRG
jgi:hypothetical protein